MSGLVWTSPFTLVPFLVIVVTVAEVVEAGWGVGAWKGGRERGREQEASFRVTGASI